MSAAPSRSFGSVGVAMVTPFTPSGEVDFDAARAVPVNLFHCGDFETVCSEFIEMLYLVLDPKRTGIVGPRFERIFRQLASVLHHLFGSDLPITLIPALLTDDGLLKRVSDSLSDIDPGLARGIRTELIANRSSEYGEVIAWTASKFERLVRSPVMRAALGTGADALDLNGVMAANGIVLHELATQRASLEDAYLELTGNSVEYTTGQPARPQPTGPRRPQPVQPVPAGHGARRA